MGIHNINVGNMNPDTPLSIKEFSDFTGIKSSTLRYYDEIGLFSPAMRGENGYRYYVPTQIVTINFISVMAELGVPLKDISEMSKTRTFTSVFEKLLLHEAELDEKLRRLSEMYEVLHTYSTTMLGASIAETDKISVKARPARKIILGGENDFNDDRYYFRTFVRFGLEAASRHINLVYPVGGQFDTFESFLSAPARPKRFFSLDPNGWDQQSAGDYLVGYERCDYGAISELPGRLNRYAEENGIQLEGPVYELYVVAEISERDPANYLLEVSAKLK